jgi:hypothetical protein
LLVTRINSGDFDSKGTETGVEEGIEVGDGACVAVGLSVGVEVGGGTCVAVGSSGGVEVGVVEQADDKIVASRITHNKLPIEKRPLISVSPNIEFT